MGEVVNFEGPTSLDIPADKVLHGAIDSKLVSVIVIGETESGEIYHASSTADLAELILAVEIFKAELMKQATI